MNIGIIVSTSLEVSSCQAGKGLAQHAEYSHYAASVFYLVRIEPLVTIEILISFLLQIL